MALAGLDGHTCGSSQSGHLGLVCHLQATSDQMATSDILRTCSLARSIHKVVEESMESSMANWYCRYLIQSSSRLDGLKASRTFI